MPDVDIYRGRGSVNRPGSGHARHCAPRPYRASARDRSIAARSGRSHDLFCLGDLLWPARRDRPRRVGRRSARVLKLRRSAAGEKGHRAQCRIARGRQRTPARGRPRHCLGLQFSGGMSAPSASIGEEIPAFVYASGDADRVRPGEIEAGNCLASQRSASSTRQSGVDRPLSIPSHVVDPRS